MTLRKIISGGQTGADQGALAAAKILGLETGGWMPRGFRTDTGPAFLFAEKYGLQEHDSPAYPPRTRLNVTLADATLIFGNPASPGCRLTIGCCHRANVPRLIVYWRDGAFARGLEAEIAELRGFLFTHGTETLNVAGNRESRAPGIHDACRDFLVTALTEGPER
jgi:hypothetical protein